MAPKVFVDGSCLAKPMSGIGRVTAESILSLQELGTDMQIVSKRPLHSDFATILSSLRKVRRLNKLKKNQPVIYWGPSHALPMTFSKELKTVVTVHDLIWKKYRETMRWRTLARETFFFRRAVSVADVVICVSHSTAADLHEHFPDAAIKSHVIYPGAKQLQVKKPNDNNDYILFVGTIEPRKNLVRLIEAFSRASKKINGNPQLVIAGKRGWTTREFEEKIKTSIKHTNISVLDNPTDIDIHTLYKYCKFLVLPSLYEGFGLPIAEALKYRKPVLTSQISSMPEVAGSAGYFVNPLSVTSIENAITELLTNTRLYGTLSRCAEKEASRFSWQKCAREMNQVFGSLAGNLG